MMGYKLRSNKYNPSQTQGRNEAKLPTSNFIYHNLNKSLATGLTIWKDNSVTLINVELDSRQSLPSHHKTLLQHLYQLFTLCTITVTSRNDHFLLVSGKK